jgi:DNA-binding LytR/AlgR family response regulator
VPIKILIIDSDKGALKSSKSLLMEANYEVFCSSSFEGGLKIIEQSEIDLILCATAISNTCGFSFLQNLNNDQNLASIPIIFIADRMNENDIDKANSLGADGYMLKPLKPEILLSAIEKKLKKYGRTNPNIEETEPDDQQETITTPKKNLTENDYLFRMIKGHPTFIKFSNIKYIAAQSAYSKVYLTDGNTYKIKKTLSEIEKIIPDNKFIRIHRSSIINLDFVDKIEKWFNNSYRVYLKDINTPLEMSRRYTSIIKNRFYN